MHRAVTFSVYIELHNTIVTLPHGSPVSEMHTKHELGSGEWWSVESTGLVRGDHVLDVDEGVFAAVHLKGLQRLLDQVTNVLTLLLTVVDSITRVPCVPQEGGEGRGRGYYIVKKGFNTVERLSHSLA